MSGQSSYLGHYERFADDSFADDQPVSAGRAFLLKNNVQHLLDQAPQHRLNLFCAANGVGSTRIRLATDEFIVGARSFPFFHTWYSPSEPTGLDVKLVLGFTGLVTGTARLRIMPDNFRGFPYATSIGRSSAPTLLDQVETLTATSNWIYDTEGDPLIFDAAQARAVSEALYAFNSAQVEGSKRPTCYVYQMRVEVTVDVESVDPAQEAAILQLYVREFR